MKEAGGVGGEQEEEGKEGGGGGASRGKGGEGEGGKKSLESGRYRVRIPLATGFFRVESYQ